MTDSLPWSKFWWRDWLADQGLRACSPAARGVWMDMLCIAAQTEPYGHIKMTAPQLARIVGDTEKHIASFLAELEAAGVFSREEDGTIFCRRMVREKERRDKGKVNGHLGGNPALLREGLSGGVNPPPYPPSQPKIPEGDKLQEARGKRLDNGDDDTRAPTREASPGEVDLVSQAITPEARLIALFDASLETTWGPERKRAWPNQMDCTTARRWLDLGRKEGLDDAGVIQIAEFVLPAVHRKLADAGHEPPRSLKFHDQDIANAIAARNQPMPAAAPRPSGRRGTRSDQNQRAALVEMGLLPPAGPSSQPIIDGSLA